MISVGCFVLLERKPSGVFDAALGIEPLALFGTPPRKRIYVQIDALDDMAVVLKAPFRFLRKLQPLFPLARQTIGVFEDPQEGRIIFLPAPPNAGNIAKKIADRSEA